MIAPNRPPLVTLFAIPKPFNERFGDIQRNAIRSWTELGTGFDVVLLGDEPGTAEAAADLGVQRLIDINRNEYGTPLMNDLFEQVEQQCAGSLFCYINADIVLMSDFAEALRQVVRRKRRFLMVGQRTDFDQEGPIDFSPGWEDRLRREVAQRGKLHRPTGIDYFVFHRGLWGVLPPMAIGRFVWDNWLIYRARQRQVTVIDATARVSAIHQNHDYSHVPGGLQQASNGAEARLNLALAGGNKHLYTIWDSTHVLTDQGLSKRPASSGSLGGGIWSYRRAAGRSLQGTL